MSTVDRRRQTGRDGRSTSRAAASARQRSFGPRGAWTCLGGFVVSIGIIGLFVSGYFRVQIVRLVGKNLPAHAIVQAAGVTGQNIFEVRSDVVIARLASVNSIQVLKVETTFPGTVTIFARARQPVAAWQQGKLLTLLDAAGARIGQATATTLPIVTGSRPPSPTQLEAIRYALRAVPREPDGAVSGFSIDPRMGLELTGKAGWRANLGEGSGQAMVTRVETLAQILARMPGRHQHLKDADLRYQHAVIHVVSP